jgi:hypothetical protein
LVLVALAVIAHHEQMALMVLIQFFQASHQQAADLELQVAQADSRVVQVVQAVVLVVQMVLLLLMQSVLPAQLVKVMMAV